MEVRESAFRSNGMEEGDDGGAVYCESMVRRIGFVV